MLRSLGLAKSEFSVYKQALQASIFPNSEVAGCVRHSVHTTQRHRKNMLLSAAWCQIFWTRYNISNCKMSFPTSNYFCAYRLRKYRLCPYVGSITPIRTKLDGCASVNSLKYCSRFKIYTVMIQFGIYLVSSLYTTK